LYGTYSETFPFKQCCGGLSFDVSRYGFASFFFLILF
jgi:hypothetical protein